MSRERSFLSTEGGWRADSALQQNVYAASEHQHDPDCSQHSGSFIQQDNSQEGRNERLEVTDDSGRSRIEAPRSLDLHRAS